MRLSIKATGVDDAIKLLTNEVKQLGDHSNFLRSRIVPLAKIEFGRVLASRGYGSWRPLARSTLAQRRRDGYGTRPLVRTGYYRRQSVGLRDLKIRRNVMEIDSPVNYAAFSEFGTCLLYTSPSPRD